MDWTELDRMLDKYYKGETTLDEERTIKSFFESAETIPDKYQGEAQMFTYAKIAKDIELPENSIKSSPIYRHKLKRWPLIGFTGIAASICLMLVLNLFPKEPKAINQIAEITYKEQKKTYYQTKEALLIVSKNLNKGKKEINRLSIFSEVQKTIIKN